MEEALRYPEFEDMGKEKWIDSKPRKTRIVFKD